jgi:hypothetical protein
VEECNLGEAAVTFGDAVFNDGMLLQRFVWCLVRLLTAALRKRGE